MPATSFISAWMCWWRTAEGLPSRSWEGGGVVLAVLIPILGGVLGSQCPYPKRVPFAWFSQAAASPNCPPQNYYILLIFFLWKEWFSELSAGPLLSTGPGRRGEPPRKGLLGGLSRQRAPGELPTVLQQSLIELLSWAMPWAKGWGTQGEWGRVGALGSSQKDWPAAIILSSNNKGAQSWVWGKGHSGQPGELKEASERTITDLFKHEEPWTADSPPLEKSGSCSAPLPFSEETDLATEEAL